MKKRPILIVKSENWTVSPYCVFDGENIIDMFDKSWIAERAGNRDISLAQAEENLTDEFFDENDNVDIVLDDEYICGVYLSHNIWSWYRFDDDGNVEHICDGGYPSLREMTDGNVFARSTYFAENGKFSTWLKKTYPEINVVIEPILGASHVDETGEAIESDLWEEFCQ